MRRYALYGDNSHSALTYNGKIITHTDRAEMEFLFPGSRVVEIGNGTPEEDTIPLVAHPSLSHLTFPLKREEFGAWNMSSERQ